MPAPSRPHLPAQLAACHRPLLPQLRPSWLLTLALLACTLGSHTDRSWAGIPGISGHGSTALPAFPAMLHISASTVADGKSTRKSSKKSSTKAGKSGKSGKKGKPTFIRSSSEETRAERDRRLHRECRGRPNAGACLGYAG